MYLRTYAYLFISFMIMIIAKINVNKFMYIPSQECWLLFKTYPTSQEQTKLPTVLVQVCEHGDDKHSSVSVKCTGGVCCIWWIIYVTGFEKTVYVHTRIEIHLIAYCNSHTRTLSRHNNKTGIDKQLCFYRQPVINPAKSRRTIIDTVRPLRGINSVAWGPILSHCTSAWLMVWSGLLWPSVWPTVHIRNLVACVWEHH